MKKRVLFISNVPSPYSVEYLNELGKLINVTGVFERHTSSERDKSWNKLNVKNFNCIVLKGIKCSVDTAFSPSVIKIINRFRNEYVIIGNPTTPTGILAIFYCKAKKIEFMLQSEGGLPGNGKGIKELFKKTLMRGAKLYLSGMNPSHDYFLTYGATVDTIVQYPFASMYQDDIRNEFVSDVEKQAAKDELKIHEKIMILYVGRFIPGKGIDTLIKACNGVNDIGVYLVGGVRNDEYENLAQQEKVKIYYVNHCSFDILRKYYLAADIFVLPTHSDTWGLVINEAMSFGLPIITTNMCVAGLELIKEGENGYIVPVNDWRLIKQHIESLIENPSKRKEIGQRNLIKIRSYSYEKMAETIYNAITRCSN